MRKLILLLVAAMLLSSVNVFALSKNMWEYGTLLTRPVTGEDAKLEKNFWVMNIGGYDDPIVTDAEAHYGDHSVLIDCTSGTDQIRIEMGKFTPTMNVHRTNTVVCEVYFKGFVEKPEQLHAIAFLYKNTLDGDSELVDAVYADVVDVDSNGWHHMLLRIPPSIDYDILRYNLIYIRRENDGMSNLYFDDMTVTLVPEKIKTNNVITEKKVVDLYSLNFTGFDTHNNSRSIKAKDRMNFSVLSGSAHIEKDRYLVFDSDRGDAECRANLFGVTTDFKVTRDNPFYVGEIVCKNGVYTVDINNNKPVSQKAALRLCVYDGEQFSFMKSYETTVQPYSSCTLKSEKLVIPFYVKKPVVKTFITY